MYKEIILTNKPNLIEWLKSDSIHILQHVQANGIVTSSQYDELMSEQLPRDVVIKLLDIILAKGENGCREFLNLLKNDDVNESSPELREWIKTVDTSVQKSDHRGKTEAANWSTQETANTAGQSGIHVTISAPGCSNIFSPTIVGSRTGPIEMNMTLGPSGKSNGLANCFRQEN